MAIGDTVQAGLLRTDFSPIQKAGQAQAQANQAFGQALGGIVDKFYQKKKDKQEKEQRKQAYLKLGMSEEVADAAKNDKDLANQFINKMNADRTYDLQVDQFKQEKSFKDLQKENIQQEMDNTTADRLRDFEAREDENQFLQSVMSQTASPQAQSQADIAMPGLPALGNGDARNRFMQAQLEQPQNQVPVSSLGSQDFGRFASREGLDPRLSVARMEGLRQVEAEASRGTGKTITIYDPGTGQNVIALQNSDGTPGEIVGVAPTQPPRIPDPRDVRRTNIDTKEDDQAMDTETDWRERAITGRNTTQTVKTMLSTLDKVDDTGGLSNFKNTLKKYAMSAGYDFTDEEKEQLANAEKFTQLSGEFVFKAISQTKGSISEKEMDLFQAMSPSMVNSKLGNRLMLEYAQKRANRDVELNKYIQGLKEEGMLPQERVQMAMDWLNDPENDITQDLYEHFGSSINSQNPSPQAQPNRPGVRGGNPQPSQGSQTSGGFKIKTR